MPIEVFISKFVLIFIITPGAFKTRGERFGEQELYMKIESSIQNSESRTKTLKHLGAQLFQIVYFFILRCGHLAMLVR
jgi:hypothetical protein